MAFTKPANQNSGSEWLPLPEGTWRFTIGAPQIKERTTQWGIYPELTFPLTLTEDEQKRLISIHGEPGAGQQQSYRVWVRGKLATAMGFYRQGKYETTPCGLAELMCASVGAKESKTIRTWMMNGGVPFVDPEATEEEEIAQLINFYSWFENLELYCQIRLEPDKTVPGKFWPRIHSMLPVGSLPGSGEAEAVYQRTQTAKVRMITSGNPAPTADVVAPEPEPVPVASVPTTTTEDEEEAELERKLAAKRALRAEAEAAVKAPERSYAELFEGEPVPV